ncbi:AbrB/MazE/SpoVT family DNA-binding domain-containing protein [Ruminococcus difficilis]|jgi:transcriptional pleiotropic regulator of transition state genes|uniref:AbrB/MazE/SpoVT family DNA-binding domain-containing protein n=1 Tax=Ruminococcus difficilis TaxID=2763069 RepID=A0A934WUN5_9FIRM|nr:AbrB/MazE/SpoVT family DNA-binding domain-containing protein [Ruminococcus difficilis]MBQ1353245.1 AbrB/MazE/SpoVT family DNA-binding domain-containing protein [Ruminococcus sp.]MDO4893236.1 AbrB/MazE/SpoVT family DNA-binding domain-containing protein [Eubacteriales bacterium]MBK6090231.1 AbrB/MazE/SpoVT family DNA-binding domain-containing protein [Ruminococcus difficilis]MBQ1830558.1 AbrB/MazE/SpoVT family DNA-binding domain-containing protein [Ruminococcus sp.]MBQ1922179.1 AbrB/MazE/SpoV
MIFTNFREIDKLGRIVISKDIRKHLGIEPGDVLQINTEGESIIIKKAEKKCIFCNGEDDLREFEGKTVCAGCLERLRALS